MRIMLSKDKLFHTFRLLPSTSLNVYPLLSPAALQLHQYGKEEGVSMPISGREAGRTGGGRGRFLITPPCTVILVAVEFVCEC